MKATLVLASAFVPAIASAYAPAPPRWTTTRSASAPTSTCLSSPQATSIVDTFKTLLAAPQSASFNATASSLLSVNFTDTSDSINLLAGIPLGTTTFPSKAAFIAGQSHQPPLNLTTLDIFFSCNKIAWRWVAVGIGSDVAEVIGIDLFTIDVGKQQITQAFMEANTGAWLADFGNPECQSS